MLEQIQNAAIAFYNNPDAYIDKIATCIFALAVIGFLVRVAWDFITDSWT